MKRSKLIRWSIACGLALVGFFAPRFLLGRSTPKPVRRDIQITARQFAYDPPIIKVNIGDELHITLKSLDVVHGFYVEGYGIDALIRPGKKVLLRESPDHDEPVEVDEIVFVAHTGGKFRYRCSQTCGALHPFMLGEMIVAPNRLYPSAIGLIIAILLGSLVIAWPTRDTAAASVGGEKSAATSS